MTTPAVLARQAAARRPQTLEDVPIEGTHGPHNAAWTADPSGARRARRRGEYRSFFTFENNPDALDLFLGQTTTWLREKGFDVPLEESGVHSGGDRVLTVIHRPSSHCHDVRLLLSERNTKRGRWDTDVTLHLPERAQGWLAVHVANDEGATAAPPRLVRWLLDVIEAHDGPQRLTPTATTVRSLDVDHLLDAVCDSDRHGLLFVVGTAEADSGGGRTFANFQDRADSWARQVVGLGQIVVLDPLATAEFNAGIGSTHGVEPWSVRTYAHEPDPAWSADARRHRIFSASRLHATPDREVGRILGLSARAHAADRRLPTSVAATDRDLRRAIDRLVLDGIFGGAAPAAQTSAPDDSKGTAQLAVPATPQFPENSLPATVTNVGEVAPGQQAVPNPRVPALEPEDTARVADATALKARVSELEASLTLVAKILQLNEVDADSLANYRARLDDAISTAAVREAHAAEMAELARARLEEQQARYDELEEDLEFHRDYAVAADELRDEAELRARRAGEEARYLRRQLADADKFEVAYGVVPDEAYSTPPDSFEDLVARVNPELESRGVVFTGDSSITGRLDSQDTSGRIVRSTWECLLALAGYVEAKKDGACQTGVHGYLTDAPTGYPVVSKNKFAPKESTSTMNKFGDDRCFPVPVEVCADGSLLMEAHFKLGTLGLVSPRMHFFDDTTATGKVYVGYIGPHLRTEQTN